MVHEIGRFNLDLCGKAGYDDEFDMAIVSEFDDYDNELRRKTFYLCKDNDNLEYYEILTESELDRLMRYSNNSRIFVGYRIFMEKL